MYVHIFAKACQEESKKGLEMRSFMSPIKGLLFVSYLNTTL